MLEECLLLILFRRKRIILHIYIFVAHGQIELLWIEKQIEKIQILLLFEVFRKYDFREYAILAPQMLSIRYR